MQIIDNELNSRIVSRLIGQTLLSDDILKDTGLGHGIDMGVTRGAAICEVVSFSWTNGSTTINDSKF